VVDRNQFPKGTYVEDRDGNRGYTLDPAFDAFQGVVVHVRWTEVLTANTVEGSTSIERIDNLTVVR
jgi:hypothetical protein